MPPTTAEPNAPPRRRPMLRTAALILSGNATSAALNLLRNLMVARLLDLVDYGIAASFAVALAVVEMTSALGLPQLMVQDRRGDTPTFQAALQGLQALRGLLNAGLLLLIAGPLAAFLGTPEASWAYRLLALVPLLRGFQHFDLVRLGRQMRYGPAILADALPILISLGAVWPLYRVFGDYRVLLFAVLIQWAAALAASHLLAERPYRLRLAGPAIAASVRFGWPLMLEGLLLFAIFNGDRLIVGRELGPAALAVFSMGVTLTLTPTLVLSNSAAHFFLPQLSAAAGGPDFPPLARATFELHLLFGGLTVLAVALLGAPFVQLALGPKYAALPPLLTWLAILQGLRVLKGGGATVSLARAMTGNALIANLIRVALLPFAWLVLTETGSLVPLVCLGILGELCGFALALGLARRRLALALRPLWPAIGLTLAEIAAAVPLALAQGAGGGAAAPGLLGLVALLFLLAVLAMGDLRRTIARRSLIRHPD